MNWLLFISSLLYHNYLLPYLHIFIYSFLFLQFALEFAWCPYRILQINYVDVDVDVLLINTTSRLSEVLIGIENTIRESLTTFPITNILVFPTRLYYPALPFMSPDCVT